MMTEPDLDSETEKRRTRAEMLAEFVWLAGPLAGLWVGVKLAVYFLPNADPLVVATVGVLPVMTVLLAIAVWRRRKHA